MSAPNQTMVLPFCEPLGGADSIGVLINWSSAAGAYLVTILPYLGRRHRLPVERELQCAGIQSAFSRRPAVSVVEEEEISVLEHADVMLVVEPVAWVGEGKVALEAADPPRDSVELRREGDHRIEVPHRQEKHTQRRDLERVRVHPLLALERGSRAGEGADRDRSCFPDRCSMR